ncbi:MAG: fluoride efflux transporter CrcB [Cyanobacteria bacterium M_surface_10_m1_298]|nr:fluoride efflux transporter CrcB [Cyanobacteria bacterium M_surface_10_m1_298]
MREALLVAIGAIPGAWLRFRLVNHFEPMVPHKHWGTFGVNVTACFALGLIAALAGRCGPDQQVGLLLGTGFLGSLSTFSTFSVELLQAYRSGLRSQAVLLMVGSVLAGLVAVLLGSWIGA